MLPSVWKTCHPRIFVCNKVQYEHGGGGEKEPCGDSWVTNIKISPLAGYFGVPIVLGAQPPLMTLQFPTCTLVIAAQQGTASTGQSTRFYDKKYSITELDALVVKHKVYANVVPTDGQPAASSMKNPTETSSWVLELPFSPSSPGA